MRILYNSKDPEHKTPFGTLSPAQPCRITVRIPEHCLTRRCYLIVEAENGAEYASFSLQKRESRDGYEDYTVVFALPLPGLYFYYFRIETQNETFSLFREGYDQTNMEAGEKWQVSCIPSDFSGAPAFAGKIMYQIFPDRFFRKGVCDTKTKLRPFRMHENMTDVPDFEPDDSGEVRNCDFFGGNLKGIAEKLDYLRDTGVSVLYLNPIFKAWSNHRYDTCDYKAVDELLGTEEDFRELCQAAHARGMKIVLDGVFSHTGSRSLYFDEKEEFGGGALHHADSPYRNWYDFHPDGTYTSWWGIKTLPCVRELQDSYLDYMIRDEDSVVAHWLRVGADGFRLDVADELPDEFIALLRRRLKEIKPDAILIGEVWEDASNKISYDCRRRYFTAGELDSVMNYPWRSAILELLTAKIDVFAFRRTIMDLWENYPPAVHHTLMNMLSTHDTVRILTALSPVAPPSGKKERSCWMIPQEGRAEAFLRLRIAFLIQFLLPGMPCVYYGDEIGMEGCEDPFCRGFYRWENAETNPIRCFCQSLAALRNTHTSLQTGDLTVTVSDPEILVIQRRNNSETVTAYLSFSDQSVVLPLQGTVLLYDNCVLSETKVSLSRRSFCVTVSAKDPATENN